MATEADLIQKFKDLNIPVGSDFEELIHEAFVGANLVDKVENHDSRITTIENNLDATKGSIQSNTDQLANKADDSKVVHNSGNEEIGGQKTFDTAPIDKATGNPYITKSDAPQVDLSNYATQQQLATKADTSAIDPSLMFKRTLTADDDVLALDAGTYVVWNSSPKNYPTSLVNFARVVVKMFSGRDVSTGIIIVEVLDALNNKMLNIYQGYPPVWSGWKVPNSITMATKSDVTTAVSTATANMVDSSKSTNFTAGLKSGGVDVATAADLKSVEDRAWRKLDNKYIIPYGGYTLSPQTTILYKIDDSNHRLYLVGFVALNENLNDGKVIIQLGSIVNSILNSNVEYIGYYGNKNYGLVSASQVSTNLMFSVAWGYASLVGDAVNNEGSFVTYTGLV